MTTIAIPNTPTTAERSTTSNSNSKDAVSWERTHFYSRLIWLWPACYAVHIFDEFPRFGTWVHTSLGGAEMTPARFWLNNSFFMTVLLTFCAVAARKQTTTATFALFTWASGHIFWNFWFHWYTTLIFHAHSPGLITSTLLYYPASLYLYYLAIRDHHIRPLHLAVALTLGISMFGGVVWAGLYHFGTFPWAAWLGD
jgi:hypothetical protein